MNILQYRQMGTRREPAQLPFGQIAVAKDGAVFVGNENNSPVEIAKWYGKLTRMTGGNKFGTNASSGEGVSVFAAVETDDFSAANGENTGIIVPEGASRIKITMTFQGWKGNYASAKAYLYKNGAAVKEVFSLPMIPDDMTGTAVEIAEVAAGDELTVYIRAATGSGDNGANLACCSVILEVLR